MEKKIILNKQGVRGDSCDNGFFYGIVLKFARNVTWISFYIYMGGTSQDVKRLKKWYFYRLYFGFS